MGMKLPNGPIVGFVMALLLLLFQIHFLSDWLAYHEHCM